MSILFWRYSLENSLKMALGYSMACTKSHLILPSVKPWPEQEHIRNSEGLFSDLDCQSQSRLNRFLNIFQSTEYIEILSDIILMLNIVSNGINNEKKNQSTIMFFLF